MPITGTKTELKFFIISQNIIFIFNNYTIELNTVDNCSKCMLYNNHQFSYHEVPKDTTK